VVSSRASAFIEACRTARVFLFTYNRLTDFIGTERGTLARLQKRRNVGVMFAVPSVVAVRHMSHPRKPVSRIDPRAVSDQFARRSASTRGFTLIEMMTVVVLITILASIAIPLATRQLRDRRTQEVAQQIASTFQNARARAMGRGSAILVRYTPGVPGSFTTLEAQRGPDATANGVANPGCAALPVSSCLTTAWNTPAAQEYRVVSTLTWPDDDDLTVSMNGDDALDICFTPGGRAFSAETGNTLLPLTRAFAATVGRDETSVRSWDVLVLPNGAARLAL
jgi:type II secretion system protein H